MNNSKTYSRLGFILSLLLLSFFSGFHFVQNKTFYNLNKKLDKLNVLIKKERALHNQLDSLYEHKIKILEKLTK